MLRFFVAETVRTVALVVEPKDALAETDAEVECDMKRWTVLEVCRSEGRVI
jgi:hypothetical protein